MDRQLIDLIPEFNLIQDKELKNRSLKVWERSIKEGGWQVSDLPDIPFTLLLEDCDIDIITHTRAVTRLSKFVAELFDELYPGKLDLNMDYLIAGALLHDAGKLLEYTREDGKVVKSELGKLHRHPFIGGSIAREEGLPSEVIHMIYAHSREGDLGKRIPEAIIVHHADFMNFDPLKSVFKHV
ncbi:MAG: HD domain-containing protein [Candidatus Eremiobacteraeota bacterium]|nr:HD domain-containing protein [Candidatus Eremiobacteraeota bacterium]